MTRVLRAGLVASLVASGLAGCIVEAPGGEKGRSNRPKPVVANVPALNVQNGAILENKIQIVGASVTPGSGVPGEPVKVTAFFKVLDEVDEDYLVFVHVEDADGRAERMNADHPPAGGAYPTRQWKKGETVKDEFNVFVPTAGVRGLNVFMGFWHPATDKRMKLMNPEAVRNDGKDRILLVQIPVSPS